MSARAEFEIAARLDENATDDRCVFAVIDTTVTVAELKAVVTRLEDEAYKRGYEVGWAAGRPRAGVV